MKKPKIHPTTKVRWLSFGFIVNMKVNMKGIIKKQENTFCVEFVETQYTEDGLNYQVDDTVEIHPEDIIKFNISDDNIGNEVKFKKQWIISEDDEFYYVRIVS
jgi:hypothetical protein